MGKDASKGPRDGGHRGDKKSFESKGQRVIASEIEKIAVDLEITPDYAFTALFPKPRRTLQDILDGREPGGSVPDAPSKKMSAAERSRQLKEIGEKMKKGR